MKITVIIPIKNRAHLIAETLDSILAQTFLPAEIILVDDHSTDHLERVIEPYADKIIYIKNQGQGPGAARNTGLQYATGDAIQFFDSDDIMSVNKLEVQASILTENKSKGVVLGPYVAAQNVKGQWVQADVIMQYSSVPELPLYDTIAVGWCSITQACLFSKELLDQIGPWREDLMTHEDKEYWFRVSLLAPYPAHENASLTIYRQHEQQITDKHTAGLDRTENAINVFTVMLGQAKGRISLLSTFVLKGMIVNYKKYCKQNGKHYQISLMDHVYGFVAKVYAKIGRLKTGTDWQPMHGINADSKVFLRYMELF